MKIVQKLLPATRYFCKSVPVPQVTVNISKWSSRAVGYQYERLTELTELSGMGTTRVNTPGIPKLEPFRTSP